VGGSVPACAVGRLRPGGAWIGFVPTADDGYALAVGTPAGIRHVPADPEDLVAIAVLYFEDGLEEPPEELAATLGDIGAIVRHAADHALTPEQVSRFAEAVDAIDDGLAADVVLERLTRILGPGVDADEHLRARVAELGV
jgi:hypothetical protein